MAIQLHAGAKIILSENPESNSSENSGTGRGIEEGRVREAATLLSEHRPPLPGMRPLTSGTSRTLYCLSVEGCALQFGMPGGERQLLRLC